VRGKVSRYVVLDFPTQQGPVLPELLWIRCAASFAGDRAETPIGDALIAYALRK
jgi:hypothetical protein